MIAIDTEYIPEGSPNGAEVPPRPDIRDLYYEVAQIAACKLNEYGAEIDRLNLFIKPSFIEELPTWWKTMTGITEQQRESGISFSEGLEQLDEFIDDKTDIWTFAGDWHVFTNSAQRHGLSLPFQEFQLARPKFPEWGIDEEDFKSKGLQVCSGNMHKVLGIDIPNELGEDTHNALHDARSLTHSVFYLRHRT